MTFTRLLLGTLRLAFPLYVVSLVLGLVGTTLALVGLAGVAGNRPWLADLLGPGWLNVLVEVGLSATVASPSSRAPVATLAIEALIVPPLLLIVQWVGYTFLAGGILEWLHASDTRRGGSPRFWSSCRRWCWPFVRLGVMGMVFVAVLVAAGGVILALAGSVIPLSVSLVIMGAWLAILFGWLETARAAMVQQDDPSASRALDRAVRLAVRPRSLLVWLILALPSAGLLVLSLSRAAGGDALTSLGTPATVVLGQVIAFLGAWLKVIRLAMAWRIVASGQGRRLAHPASPAERPGLLH